MLSLFAFTAILNAYFHAFANGAPLIYDVKSNEYCKFFFDQIPKLPEEVQEAYGKIHAKICNGSVFKPYDIVTNIEDILPKDGNVEVHAIQSDKEIYCNFILQMMTLNVFDGGFIFDSAMSPIDYLEFKENCKDASKDKSSIIPLAEALLKSKPSLLNNNE